MLHFHSRAVLPIAVLTAALVWLLIACSGASVPFPAAKSPPPWFGVGTWTTNSLSAGTPYSLDKAGNPTGNLPKNQVTCYLRCSICADVFVKQKVIKQDAGEKCPDSLHFSRAPQVQVDCAKWDEAKRTKVPCDPLVDADCDGVANDADEWPLDFYKQ